MPPSPTSGGPVASLSVKRLISPIPPRAAAGASGAAGQAIRSTPPPGAGKRPRGAAPAGGVGHRSVTHTGRRGGGGPGGEGGGGEGPPPAGGGGGGGGAGGGERGRWAPPLAPFPVPPFFILKPRVSRADSGNDSRLGTDGNQLSRGASRRGGGRRRPSHFRSSWTVRPSMPPATT